MCKHATANKAPVNHANDWQTSVERDVEWLGLTRLNFNKVSRLMIERGNRVRQEGQTGEIGRGADKRRRGEEEKREEGSRRGVRQAGSM